MTRKAPTKIPKNARPETTVSAYPPETKEDDFEGACDTFGAQSEAIDINKHLITV